MNTPRRGGLTVDIFLVLVMCALYFVTSEPDAAETVARISLAPTYRGRSEDAVALEFAVYWNAGALEDILHILDERGAKVTFAVSGEWAEENPELLGAMAGAGHEIATMGHAPAMDGRAGWIEEDVRRSMDAIETACGVRPERYYSGDRAVRPSARAAKRIGVEQVVCTVDLACARGGAEDIVKRGLNETILGSIILLEPTFAASHALGPIIDGLAGKGINVVRVCDVAGGGG